MNNTEDILGFDVKTGFDKAKWSKKIDEELQRGCHFVFARTGEPGDDNNYTTEAAFKLPEGMTYFDFIDYWGFIVDLYKKYGAKTLSELREKLDIK